MGTLSFFRLKTYKIMFIDLKSTNFDVLHLEEFVIIGDLKKFKMANGGHFEFPAVAKITHAGPTAIFVW